MEITWNVINHHIGVRDQFRSGGGGGWWSLLPEYFIHVAILVSFLIPKCLCLNKPPVFANQFAINCAISALSENTSTRSATEKLVHSLISSRLDIGNGLLYNLPNSQIGQLQKLQNAAARVVSLSSKRSHITPILKTLHWLPVKERIIFKILLFVYYIVNGTAPDYNKSLLRLYQPTRTLRSSNSGLLQIPLSKKSWGERAFAHAGPALWNSLPQELKDSNSSTSFKGEVQ